MDYLPGDSKAYELLTRSAMRVAHLPGLTCEIGLREGGGTKAIIDGLHRSPPAHRTHIAIDPYGSITYAFSETQRAVMDYSNEMRDKFVPRCYHYAAERKINFLFFCMTDLAFFELFRDGVPVYPGRRLFWNLYRLVHIDGPHDYDSVRAAVEFFVTRTVNEAEMIFDDTNKYDHKPIHDYLYSQGWSMVDAADWDGGARAVYRSL